MNSTWTNANDARYAELLRLLQEADEPGQYSDLQAELVDLRSKALALGMDVDPLPF
jgi:hypothetical protein